MQAITDTVIAEINRQLPAAVGDVLKKRLQDADAFEAKVATLTAQVEKLTAQVAKASDVESREQKVAERERMAEKEAARLEQIAIAQKHREEMLTLREKHAAERVLEMRSVVQDVFGNARFKYSEIGSLPVPAGPNGFLPHSAPYNKTIEGTGP